MTQQIYQRKFLLLLWLNFVNSGKLPNLLFLVPSLEMTLTMIAMSIGCGSFVVAADPPQTPPSERGGFRKPPRYEALPCNGRGVWGDPTTGKAHERSTGFDHTHVDLLVTFHPEAKITLFGLENVEMAFQTLFRRPVDLVTKRAIERSHNWIRRQNILGNARTIMSRVTEILLDLDRACRLILNFTAAMSKDDFEKDIKTQSSVLYQIIIIGEAVNRLSQAFKDAHPQIAYSQIKGMGNPISHEYKDVDLEIIWDAIATDIPGLLHAIGPWFPQNTFDT